MKKICIVIVWQLKAFNITLRLKLQQDAFVMPRLNASAGCFGSEVSAPLRLMGAQFLAVNQELIEIDEIFLITWQGKFILEL